MSGGRRLGYLLALRLGQTDPEAMLRGMTLKTWKGWIRFIAECPGEFSTAALPVGPVETSVLPASPASPQSHAAVWASLCAHPLAAGR
jgi:hypothetical protein